LVLKNRRAGRVTWDSPRLFVGPTARGLSLQKHTASASGNRSSLRSMDSRGRLSPHPHVPNCTIRTFIPNRNPLWRGAVRWDRIGELF